MELLRMLGGQHSALAANVLVNVRLKNIRSASFEAPSGEDGTGAIKEQRQATRLAARNDFSLLRCWFFIHAMLRFL